MARGKIKLLGIIGFILLLFCCLFFKVNSIEADLSARTATALSTNNISIDSVLVNGRDITLKGVVASNAIKTKAGKIAENIWGVRTVNNLLTVKSKTSDIPISNIQKKLDNIIAIRNIEFENNKSTIRKNSLPILKKVIGILKEYPEISIEIGGHTDSRGNAMHNMLLSKKRAETVMTFLIKNGVNKSRLKVKGYGLTKPIADNDTEEGRKKNRRVEFKIIKEK